MRTCVIDVESFWSAEHSLSKMNPIVYCMHPDTEIISIAIKFDNYPTDVIFGEDKIKHAVSKLDWANTLVIGHNNSGFDAMILKWRLGINPRMWGCTLAMARPIHAKTVGLSLGKLVAHYKLGVKDNTALLNTKGRRLADFTAAEIDAMREYNRADTDQCYALFNCLKPHYTAKELWHIDANIRMLLDTAFRVDVPMLETALSVERDRKRKHILQLARHLITAGIASDEISTSTDVETLEEAVRTELASAPKFGKLLESLGEEVPMKVSPTNPEKMTPALAKTDEAFIALQNSDNELVSAAARARLAVKSTLLETRIGAFIEAAAATGGYLPVPIHYCGADTTGRDSGWGYNPQNLPRVNPGSPKVSDALRNCIQAPPGHMVVVADLSGIELRVNHFLWKVPASMALYQGNPLADLYTAFAAARYDIPMGEVDKTQRQMGKVAHLGLGFGAGAVTFRRFAKAQYNLEISEEDSVDIVAAWRIQYAEIAQGWKTCGARLKDIREGVETAIDPWGLCVTHAEGVRLPSGRLIRYPEMRQEPDGQWPDGRDKASWFYASGRHKTRLTGPKVDENLVQALARDALKDYKLQVFQATGYRSALDVHDELVYVVPEKDAQAHLDTVQSVMRTPPKWWPELITWSEGDIARRYGGAK